ncbi:DUF305 domain-containing protein [Prauserella oleivorans]|uniref:DUF305 domain-containing protein n=1 Tax=Prauserella oleivorans TaxID=1478153 RepID=A0ABW5WFM4_9PSEU
MADPAAEDPTTDEDVPRQSSWSRVVIFGAATLAVLLIGATIGMLIARTGDDERPAGQPGPVDIGFAQDMSVHHLQAVTMANWARDHSTDPAIVQLAFDIASTQTEQIGRMKGWLMLWGQPEEPIGEYMTWMSEPDGHGHGHGSGDSGRSEGATTMPGMASQQELNRLRSLSGRELDVYFLQLMLRHHQGGTEMAEYGYDHASIGAVRTLARSILASQGPEMNTMRTLLRERGGEPLPFP